MLKRGIEYYNHCAMCFKVSDDVSSVSHTGLNINNSHNIAPAAWTLRSTSCAVRILNMPHTIHNMTGLDITA